MGVDVGVAVGVPVGVEVGVCVGVAVGVGVGVLAIHLLSVPFEQIVFVSFVQYPIPPP